MEFEILQNGFKLTSENQLEDELIKMLSSQGIREESSSHTSPFDDYYRKRSITFRVKK